MSAASKITLIANCGMRIAECRQNPPKSEIRNPKFSDYWTIAGQSTIEWVVFVVVLIMTMIAMRPYLVAAVCGRWREAADQFGYGRQYEPGLTTITTQ